MSENWTREHMVEVYGEAGADAMRKLSDAYARIERLEEAVRRMYRDRGERDKVFMEATTVMPELARFRTLRGSGGR